ncbi:MAG: GNAT family N-acetyltransferase [Verrucomicrobiaceae bacterium]|nr:GNAT family N-acetyltransferase [Verrucomicrobiaceae bacterium]
MIPQSLLQSIKVNAGTSQQFCLEVGSPVQAVLRPVATSRERLDFSDIYLLTQWRNRHCSSFLTEFTATPERTALWLTKIVGPDNTRVLFMVESPRGEVVGYMGLAFIDWTTHEGEADAVVRGRDAPRGLMTDCLRSLLNWARGPLGLQKISVRVRSDNPALEFYRKFGFMETRREHLQRTERNGDVVWQIDNDHVCLSEPQLVHMNLLDVPSTPPP